MDYNADDVDNNYIFDNDNDNVNNDLNDTHSSSSRSSNLCVLVYI